MRLVAKLVTIHAVSVWYIVATRKAAGKAWGQEAGAIVSKVVVMLEGMVKDAVAEKRAEEVAYTNFSQWCTGQVSSLDTEIAAQSAIIEETAAEAANLDEQAKALFKEIDKMQYNVRNYTEKLSEAGAQRENDHAGFLKTEEDYSESVSALQRAITVLQEQDYDRPALLQLSASQLLPSQAIDIAATFAEMMVDEPGHNYTVPAADAYEFQSKTVIATLTQLHDTFRGELAECRKAEMSSAHNYDMEALHLKNLIDRTNEDIGSATTEMQKQKARSASAKKENARALELKTAEEATLEAVTTECNDKKASYEGKQKLREDEIAALQKAIEILSHDDVQGMAGKSFAQSRSAAALAQVGDASFLATTSSTKMTGVRAKLYAFLTSEAKRLNSTRIHSIIERAVTDPFREVKIIISDIMERLQDEAHQDATHEGYCNKELGVNNLQRESFTADIDGLTADIQTGKSSIGSMTQEIADLTTYLANEGAERHEATMARLEEKRVNAATERDCRKGEAAVAEALALLKEFYAKARQATALVQKRQEYPWMHSEEWNSLDNSSYVGGPDAGQTAGTQTFGDVYNGKQDEANGILAILDVIMSDFASLRAETEVSEAAGEREHQNFMDESDKDMAVKTKKIELLNADKGSAQIKLDDDSQDLKAAQDKLAAADRYLVDLKKQCDVVPQTYEERTAARAAEIQSLQEALKILTYEDIASANDKAVV